jgi:PKD repeat protein
VPVGSGNPTAIFTPTQSSAGQPVVFDASASTAAPDASIASYSWSFPGSSLAVPSNLSSVQETVTYAAGTYTATLTVTDSKGRKGISQQVVTVK